MNRRPMKYNPAFLSGDELVETFVVRQAELGLIVQVLRENEDDANQHLLVIGPRGIGKTTLVLRAMEEVRRQTDLSQAWYPLVFSEESYIVTNAGEFWLEAIFHLGQQTDEARWKKAYEELQREKDQTRLRERALAQLMDFADSEGKRVLLVVENLNMLLGQQMNDDEGWVLRHTLLHESRIMLLATATSRFEQIDHTGKPMFELFRTIELEPLNEEECRRMWTSIGGAEPSDGRIRPIRILTRRQSSTRVRHLLLRRTHVLQGTDGRSNAIGGRAHGVLQEPSGQPARDRTKGVPGPGRSVGPRHCPRSRGKCEARRQQGQFAPTPSRGTGRRCRSGGTRAA